MSTVPESLLEQVKSLTTEQKEDLRDELEILLAMSDDEVQDAWLDVARTRLTKLREGTAPTVSFEEVMLSLEKRQARLPARYRGIVEERISAIQAGETEFFTYEEVIEGLKSEH